MKAMVHDQGYMELAGKMLEAGCKSESISCAAHRLQLCVNEGLTLSPISRAVAASKKLVGHFRHSALATQAEEKAGFNGIGTKEASARLSYALELYFIIKSLLCNMWSVVAVLSDETVTKRQYRCLDISSKNWEFLMELVKVLHPIEVAITFLSEEYNSSLSVILPVRHGIVRQLMTSNEDEDDLPIIREF